MTVTSREVEVLGVTQCDTLYLGAQGAAAPWSNQNLEVAPRSPNIQASTPVSTGAEQFASGLQPSGKFTKEQSRCT